MKIYAINGGPRKNYNTAKLLEAFMAGARDAGADVERIDIYDLNFKGCMECYACKRIDAADPTICVYPDDLKPLLSKLREADGICFATPVFFSEMTAQLRCLLERFFYPFTQFRKDAPRVVTPKPIRTAFLYTMNISEETMRAIGYPENHDRTHRWVQHILGTAPDVVYACDTYQFTDPSRYAADIWDWAQKAKTLQEQFPKDLQAAYDCGRRMAEKQQ